MLSQEIVKFLFDYDEDSGIFVWKVRVAQRTRVGDVAGSVTPNGRIQLKIFGKNYLAHRVAWLWAYGEMPEGFIDHINRNPLDNRLCNLRLATNQENKRNGKRYRNNTSGYRGVTNKDGRFEALLKVNGDRIYLGRFDTAEEASSVVEKKAKEIHDLFYSEVNRAEA